MKKRRRRCIEFLSQQSAQRECLCPLPPRDVPPRHEGLRGKGQGHARDVFVPAPANINAIALRLVPGWWSPHSERTFEC
jgi:hypothetical protein